MIGVGGMGIVYRAEQLALSRPVALKVLSPHLSRDPAYRERFRREGAHAAALHHPNIVPIYDSGERDGVLFLAMMLVRGSSLAETLADGPIPLTRALSILRPIANALDAAHSMELVHRDVKPQNILMDQTGTPLLVDFGIAKAATQPGLTATREFLGSVNYAAPEQIRGLLSIAPAADIYSLAAILYECLDGAPPFARDSEAAVMHAQLSDPPPDLSSGDSALSSVIRRGLAKDANERFSTAGELIAAAAVCEHTADHAASTDVAQLGVTSREQRTILTDRDAALTGVASLPAGATVADRRRSGQGPLPTHSDRPRQRRSRWRFGVALAVLLAGAAVALVLAQPRTGTHTPPRRAAVAISAPVSLVVSSPTEGSAITSSATTVRGTVSPSNARVEIEGRDVTVSDGSFSGSARLRQGSNRIQVTAAAPGHRSARATVAVSAQLPNEGRPSPKRPSTPKPPVLEEQSPPGGDYSIRVPAGWTYFAESSPEGTTTDAWVGSRESEKLQVLISECGTCAESDGSPDPAGVGLPTGTVSSFEINSQAVGYEAFEAGNPLPDQGVIVVTMRHGSISGYAQADVWIPSALHSTATAILNSFSPLAATK